MATPTITVDQTGRDVFFRKAFQDLDGDQIYVGIPEKETRRNRFIGPQTFKQAITNAGLLYIHTNGSLKWNIPARPVIEPAIQANRLAIEGMLMNAASERLDGNIKESNKWLANCGQFAANACKRWFTDPRNGWPQDAPETIRRKLQRLRNKKNWMTVSHRQYLNKMTVLQMVPQYRPQTTTTALDSINTPLIDKGELRRAITYVTKRQL